MGSWGAGESLACAQRARQTLSLLPLTPPRSAHAQTGDLGNALRIVDLNWRTYSEGLGVEALCRELEAARFVRVERRSASKSGKATALWVQVCDASGRR